MTHHFESTNDHSTDVHANTYTAFAGARTLARGGLEEVIRTTKECIDAEPELRVVILDDATSRHLDFDFDGSAEDVVARAIASVNPSRVDDRPLGCVSHAVSLLPRHWEWLQRRPEGANLALQRLIDEAEVCEGERSDAARAATGRLMWAMARDLPDFEQASQALSSADEVAFRELSKRLPRALREHLEVLVRQADASTPSPR